MTRSAFRAGGRNTNIRFAIGQRDLEDRFPEANLVGGDEEFAKLVFKVVGFVEAPGTDWTFHWISVPARLALCSQGF